MKVVISGYYGFGNIGDEAVLGAIIHGLKTRQPEIEIIVLSNSPQETESKNDVKSIPRLAWFKIFKALLWADTFISGGGSLFQDKTSSHSFWYYITLVLLAKLTGNRVMVFAQGVGPLEHPFNRFVAKNILRWADKITLRDASSKIELEKIGLKPEKLIITADPSFLLKFSSKTEGGSLLGHEGIPHDKKLLGIVVRGFHCHPETEDSFYKTLAEAINHISEKYNFLPVFLFFYRKEDKRPVVRTAYYIRKRFHAAFSVSRPEEMLAIFPYFEALIGVRLHSLVFAAMNGIPMVGLSYDPKVAAFLKTIDMPCLDIKPTLGAQEIENAMDRVVRDKEKIKISLEAKAKEMKKQAEYNFDLLFDMSWSTRI